MPSSKDSFSTEFIAETNEHISAINQAIIVLKNNTSDKTVLNDLLRHLHTIKGTARMMGFATIEALSHGLEDVFKGIKEERFELTDHIVQLTFATSDCILRALTKVKNTQDDTLDITLFIDAYKQAASGFFFTVDALEQANKGEQIEQDIENSIQEASDLENITSIRIDIERINEIVKSLDNLIIRQFRFKHELELYEKQYHEIPKQLKEDLILIEKTIFDTQHQILDLRMLPLNMVLAPLRKEIESEAIKLQKKVYIDIPETNSMLDKIILEKLVDILMHLVRNSLDHGIELPQERKEKGKSEQGTIAIHTYQIANHLKIVIHDDGRGIQYEKVRQKAIELHPNEKKEISDMSNRELQQYIFSSGFSTNSTTTALSGRGIGLDVVRNNMEKIKGKIHLTSKQNEGTTFELVIPLSLATQEGLFVHASSLKFMIPSHYIQEIIDPESYPLVHIQTQTYIRLHEQLIPVYYLSSLLNINTTTSNTVPAIIVVEYLETQMAIVVDSLEQYENVVVNPLPRLLTGMKAIQGVVYDENYAIIPILNIPDIMQRLKGLVAYDIKKYKTKTQKKTYTILIVDDSTTTRQIEQTIFETDGYIVHTAVDGIDAIEQLRTIHADAIVTDINMPRMDGLTLLSNIRHMDDYANTPVIIVSGAYDPEAKHQFIEAGAQAFIVKSEFQRGNLIQAVKEFLGE
ncbi:MAG: response regulator [Treponema sp.]|nr:response regulator [Treponema sp.]